MGIGKYCCRNFNWLDNNTYVHTIPFTWNDTHAIMSLVACVLLSSAGTNKGDKENLLEFGDHHSMYCTWVVIYLVD